ncbi:alkaline phosphatase [Pseudidiomarina mangrovi]|uniref:alkaline phosphatase n=1 Tax=Pseudidiomarina mangrovi TaxID=2487133 RepID=UPI000FCBA3DC|nr:alkaline phosphatase [Pseudidiomarina mangrovi]
MRAHSKRLKYPAIALAVGLLTACQSPAPVAPSTPPSIIFMVGDGMGFEYISAYRYAHSELGAEALTPTVFDDLLVGAATTYPDDDTWVTDSAAAATALATGVKSYNGAIGLDTQQQPLTTMMEVAKQQGWGTGAVVSVQVTHATPAAFFTHHASRTMYDAIADSYAQQVSAGEWGFDVLLGGGQSHFVRDDKNWLPELTAQGLHIATEIEQLNQLQHTPVLGLFAPLALPHSIDAEPQLAAMTTQALRLLQQQQQSTGKPFALMVEGSLIDWCGHANDIACAVHEVADFANAIKVVLEYQQQHPNTLVVITADHSTGGLTLGQGGEYAWYSDKVMGIKASLEVMTRGLLTRQPSEFRDYLSPLLNLPLTEQQWQQLEAVQVPDELRGRARQMPHGKVLVEIISAHTRTGWTTTGHTAVDVPVLAIGPGAEKFRGYQDNTEIAKLLLSIMQQQ